MIQKIKFKFLLRAKYLYHLVLFFIFKFDSWHVSPIESRPYCLDVVDYINFRVKKEDTVVEVGCGLGETISSIDCLKKYGYDKSADVIRAAKLFDRNKYPTIFKTGSFEIPIGLDINYLITLNFLHDFSSEQVIEWFKLITENNNVLNIIVDELEYDQYLMLHKYDSLLPIGYKEIYKIQNSYTFGRSIKVFSVELKKFNE